MSDTPHIRQAVLTRFLPPTNTRGPRIVATCQAGRIVVPWNAAQDTPQNHVRACRALRRKLMERHAAACGHPQPNLTLDDCPSWGGQWIGGSLPDGSVAWVQVPGEGE